MVALAVHVREISDIRLYVHLFFLLYRTERENWKNTIFTPTDS